MSHHEKRLSREELPLEHFIANLPETALANDRIYRWLLIDIIEHYESHRSPNGPRLR
jgi:hypothetical protein